MTINNDTTFIDWLTKASVAGFKDGGKPSPEIECVMFANAMSIPLRRVQPDFHTLIEIYLLARGYAMSGTVGKKRSEIDLNHWYGQVLRAWSNDRQIHLEANETRTYTLEESILLKELIAEAFRYGKRFYNQPYLTEPDYAELASEYLARAKGYVPPHTLVLDAYFDARAHIINQEVNEQSEHNEPFDHIELSRVTAIEQYLNMRAKHRK